MRILFFGTSDFAVPSLEKLANAGRFEVIGVVTQPDRPQGRGQRMSLSPVKQASERLGLRLFQPKRVRSPHFIETVRSLKPDALALAAFGQIIPPALLDIPPLGPINVHGSLLPAWRGAAPIQYSLLSGDTRTGVSTMWMDATLDTGDILLQQSVDISETDTTGTLTPRLAEAGAQLLIETLELLAIGNCPRIVQNHGIATYAPPIKPEDSHIRWSDAATMIANRIRALSPRPGVFTEMKGKRIKLWLASPTSIPASEVHPGSVLSITRESVLVGAGVSGLNLVEVQQENGRRMSAPDWARGARIAVGDVFGE